MNKIMNRFKSVDNNDRIVLKNTFFSFVVKGMALAISLLSTPAFITYFNNNEILGVWYTMLSVLIWFLNFDLGIGNGIRNQLTVALSKNNRKKVKYIISSGIFVSGIVSFVLMIIGIIFLKLINLNSFLNISGDIISNEALYISAGFVFIAIVSRFFLTTISAIFYALQKSSINDFLAFCVSVLQLLYVLVFKFNSMEESLIYLSFSYMIFSNLPILIGGIVVFLSELKDCKPNLKYVKKEYIRSVLSIGSIFFICQILYMLIINTNEFLITNLFGPKYTTEYTFYYKITSLISMVINLAMTPIWSVITKAMTEKKWVWLNSLYSKIKKISLLVIVFEFLMIPFMQLVFNIWLGNNAINVDYFISFAFACFGSVFVYSSMLSTIVCGLAKMRLQTICYTIGVVVKFLLILIISNYTNNWSIVVWSNAIILLPYCILQQIWLNQYFNNKIRGEKNNESI